MDRQSRLLIAFIRFLIWSCTWEGAYGGLRRGRLIDLPREYALYHWDQLRPKFPHCNVPTHYELADVDWSSDSDVYYFPLLHPQDQSNYIEAVLGYKLLPNQSPSSACLTKQWSLRYPNELISNEARVRAWDLVSAQMNCQQIGTKFAYDCLTDDGGHYHRVYMLRPEVGDQEWHLAYTCWESGATGWSVYTQIPSLSPAVKASVLRRVKALGFAEYDHIELNYEACTGVNESHYQTL